MNQHMVSLQEKHAALEAKLADELSHPWPNANIVAALKREKLSIKDEMHGMRRH